MPNARPAHPTMILAIICLSYFMVILDNSIIFTGLPRIEAAMSFSPTGLTWVQDAYTLVFGGLLLLGARSGDIVGRRRMFIVGLVLFGLASFLVGVAPTAWWLIAARALQGIGAAILAPSSLSLLTASFAEGHQRAKAVAAYSAVAGIGASAGLVVGGVLADLVSWRAGFFLNVPIAAAMIVLALRVIGETGRRRGRFDLIGALCATLGMTALVFGIVDAAEAGWTAPTTIGAFIIGILLLAALVVNEARAEQPIMPLRLFASRERTGAYLVRMLYLGAMMGFFFFTTQYLQGVLGFSPLQAGVAFLPMSAVNFGVALLVNRLVGRFGATPVLIAGVALTLAGMGWLSRAGAGSGYLVAVALPMVLIGIGQGLAFAPLTSAGLAGVDAPDAGAASGLVNTFHQVGSSLGLGVLVSVAAAAVPDSASARTALVDRVGTALTGSTVMLAVALLLVVTLIVRIRRGQDRPPRPEPAAAPQPEYANR
ncbi:MFS transporter [Actinoplanes sp. LDG1-06]|uniref:MFS transporter n=1 Tax=Paractinoplanes ovalisporus TaxID=2810368 RepID=A0ABS2ASL4_9ACTN|nr:MFS transporter [Actinoplanes ovalisporus]MBM2622358.1 MFS transporter [Actinoplanes ovalisporus]